jgi:hypothetical protein
MPFPSAPSPLSAERIAGLIQPVVVALGITGVVGGVMAGLAVLAGPALRYLGLGLAQR